MTTEAQKGEGGNVHKHTDNTDRGHQALAMPCDPMASPMPWQKYRSHVPLQLHDRTWPDRQFKRRPRWC